MNAKSFVIGALAGAILASANAALSTYRVQVIGGVVGVVRGDGFTTVVCTQPNGEVLDGSTIEARPAPLSDGRNSATGATFRCP